MNKEEFLRELRRRLDGLPAAETEKYAAFYAESIDDRMEDGMSETEAVAALGDMDSIVRAIESEMPVTALVMRRVGGSRARAGHRRLWTALVIVGSPLWFPLLLAACVTVLSVYLVLWALILSLFAVLLALAVTGIAASAYGFARLFHLGIFGALMVFGASAVCFGLAILLEEPIRAMARWLLRLGGRLWGRIWGRVPVRRAA